MITEMISVLCWIVMFLLIWFRGRIVTAVFYKTSSRCRSNPYNIKSITSISFFVFFALSIVLLGLEEPRISSVGSGWTVSMLAIACALSFIVSMFYLILEVVEYYLQIKKM